jgi:DNA-binding response OmpR family regulator
MACSGVRAAKARSQNPCGAAAQANDAWPWEIMVVEDGSGIFSTLGTMLQSRGFQVILAPDVQTALEEMDHYEVAAVIAGAGQEPEQGLDLLAAVKERRAEVKTLMVTQRLQPALPLRAYTMDIDDYLHWPLSGRALSARLRSLLSREVDAGQGLAPAEIKRDVEFQESLASWEALLDSCTGVMEKISQTVEHLRTRFLGEMTPQLAGELEKLALLLRTVRTRLEDALWHQNVACRGAGWRPCRCH